MPGLDLNTVFLDLHGTFMVLSLVFFAFVFGAIWFVKEDNAILVRRLRISAWIAFLSFVLLMITGLIPDIFFGSGSTFSGVWHTQFGNFSAHVTDDQVGNLTGPLMFDIMEHVSFIVVGLAAVILYLIWTCAGRVFTDLHLKRSILTLMSLSGVWVLVIGAMGVYLTKILTFPAF